MYLKTFFILLIIVISSQDSYPLNLPELIELVRQHPEILVIKERLTAQKAKIGRVQTLPDPMVELGLGNARGMVEGSIMFQQAFPYPGKLPLMGEVEQRQLKMLEAELSAITLEKIALTKKDYYELFEINKAIEITNRTKEHLKHIEGIANTMYASGMIPQTDILRIQTEISMQTEKLIMLEAKKGLAIYRLMWLDIGLPQDSSTLEVSFPPELIPTELKDYEELQRISLQNSPMLKMVEYQAQMGEKEVDLAKKEFKPDFVSSAEVMG
ncbi:MAG: TolC family protein, partial [Candidatus Desantisbacteria bacterium]